MSEPKLGKFCSVKCPNWQKSRKIHLYKFFLRVPIAGYREFSWSISHNPPTRRKKMSNMTGWSFQDEFLSRPALMLDYLMLKFFGWKEFFKSDPLDRLGFQRKPFSSSLNYLLEYSTSRSNHFSNQPLIMKDWWLGVKSFDYEESSSYPKRRDPLIGEHLSSDLKLKQSLSSFL